MFVRNRTPRHASRGTTQRFNDCVVECIQDTRDNSTGLNFLDNSFPSIKYKLRETCDPFPDARPRSEGQSVWDSYSNGLFALWIPAPPE